MEGHLCKQAVRCNHAGCFCGISISDLVLSSGSLAPRASLALAIGVCVVAKSLASPKPTDGKSLRYAEQEPGSTDETEFWLFTGEPSDMTDLTLDLAFSLLPMMERHSPPRTSATRPSYACGSGRHGRYRRRSHRARRCTNELRQAGVVGARRRRNRGGGERPCSTSARRATRRWLERRTQTSSVVPQVVFKQLLSRTCRIEQGRGRRPCDQVTGEDSKNPPVQDARHVNKSDNDAATIALKESATDRAVLKMQALESVSGWGAIPDRNRGPGDDASLRRLSCR